MLSWVDLQVNVLMQQLSAPAPLYVPRCVPHKFSLEETAHTLAGSTARDPCSLSPSLFHAGPATEPFRSLSHAPSDVVCSYGGQLFIIIALACGSLFVTGTVLLLLSMAVIKWNVKVAQGQTIPWWANPTQRGW